MARVSPQLTACHLDVVVAFHCVSLHETRAPYSPTLMRGHHVHQVFFPGTHSHLGWIEDNEGLVHAPLAWMIQQLHTHLGLNFDEERLAARFPSYGASYLSPRPSITATSFISNNGSDPTSTATPITLGAHPDVEYKWCQGRILPYSIALLAVIGKKRRCPGHVSSVGDESEAKVHIGARLRTVLDGVEAVPGYMIMAPPTGRPYWQLALPKMTLGNSFSKFTSSLHRNKSDGSYHGSRKSEDSNTTRRPVKRIEEAKIGALEAKLLGLPQEVVSN